MAAFQTALLRDAMSEAQRQRAAWNESREQMKEQQRVLTQQKRDLAKQKKSEERAKKRVRAKCASIPTAELMLELEYRTELKAKVMERLRQEDPQGRDPSQ